jgi:hypothetical protein
MYLTTKASAKATLDDLIARLTTRVSENPRRVTEYANEIEEWRGITDTLSEWERWESDASGYFKNAAELVTAKCEWIGRMGTESPDDTWSGRGNDGRRAYADGRRKALLSIREQISGEVRALNGASA